eukprot:scaffold75012_cov43-Attheya_sp.AAC.2
MSSVSSLNDEGRSRRPLLLAAGQKTPSLYMVVAMAQSFAWFFGLPILCKPLWGQLFHDRSPNGSELILNLATILGTFAIYMAVIFPIYWLELPFFEQYKIDPDHQWPWKKQQNTTNSDSNSNRSQIEQEDEAARKLFWAMTKKSVQLMAINQCLLIPFLTHMKHVLFPTSAPSFDVVEDWPSYWELLRDNGSMCLLHELGFYVTHRMMHSHKYLYQFHKVHHEYKQNNVMAAQHNHPIDYILTIVSPALLSTIIVNPHSVTQFQFGVWILVTNLDDHCGYSFPWSPVRWFPFASLTEQHEFHHAINMGCFASKLNIYDKIFNSETTYLKWSKKRDAKSYHPAKEE